LKGSRKINTVSERAKSAYGNKSHRSGNETAKHQDAELISPNAGGLTQAKLNSIAVRERPATSS